VIEQIDYSWRKEASCKEENPDIFYPDMATSQGQKIARFAIKICSECPVRVRCAEHGIRHERYGVWGGMTEGERVRYRRDRKIVLETELFNTRLYMPQERK
jgi:WhiB family redox-sensing transcriptional regulator